MLLNSFYKHRYSLTLVLVLTALGIFLLFNLPGKSEYYYNADEGIYYMQAKEVATKGLNTFTNLADQYIKNKDLQIFPPPLRVGYILPASFFIRIKDSISSLSYFSLISYLLLIISTFIYAKKFWGEKIALLLALLLSVSPLGMGTARRALLDTELYLLTSLTFFSFIDYLDNRKETGFYLFCLFLTLACLVKETSFLLIPFFTFYLLLLNILKKTDVSYRHIYISAIFPTLISAVILILTFKSPERICLIFNIFSAVNLTTISGYWQWLHGPWYTYIIEYLIFSPITTLITLGYIGHFIFSSKKDLKIVSAISLLLYTLFTYSFLIKNPRYVLNLDLLIRLLAVIALSGIYQLYFSSSSFRKYLSIAVIIFILAIDLQSFNNIFIVNKVYDPIAFNLLRAENIIPSKLQYINPQEQTEAMGSDRATDYFNRGYLFYQRKEYQKSIEANLEAIKLKPDYALAYNNLAAAYGALAKWPEEIVACEKALEIDPNLALAKNNLLYAKSMLKKQRGN